MDASYDPAKAVNHWIAVMTKLQAEACQDGSYLRLSDGSGMGLGDLLPGDGVLLYANRNSHIAVEFTHDFVGIGVVTGEAPYQADGPGGRPEWRLACAWSPVAVPVSVWGLREELSVTARKGRRWGLVFRQSLVQIPRTDFERVARELWVAPPTRTAV